MGKRGPKPGTGGRPKKALYDKIMDGNPGKHPMMVLGDNVNCDTSDVEPPDYIEDNEIAQKFFYQVVGWLREVKCLGYVYPELIGEYAAAKARWQECYAKGKKGLLAKHPTTQLPMQSPYVSMEWQYLKIANQLWNEIWTIVKENSTVEFRNNNPNEDVMEAMLNRRERQG